MALTLILFLIGFVILIKGADLLVDGASSVANRFNVSNIVIGLTIVAFGTSMPELVVNLFASFQGNADIAIGNILGSNIANILLILGISSMIYPLAAKRNTVLKEIPFSLLAALVMAFMANDILLDGAAVSEISRSDGLVFLSFFAVFIYYSFSLAKEEKDIQDGIRILSTTRAIVYVLLGLLGLILGGKWIVDGAVVLAEMIGLSEAVIGLTVVAIGTSLPELATSAIAAYKKQSDIAIGNVVGSNIFNLFWILGCSSVIRPLPFNAASNYDVLATVLASLVLFLVMFVGKRHIIQRWQGGLMLTMYVGYTIFLLVNSH